MNLPKIDISSLPDLTTLTASFGSLFNSGRIGGSDDSSIAILVFVYERILFP